MIVALFAVITAMTGIAAAFETISAIPDGTNIITTVGNLADDKYYQLRYYPPNTFICNTGSSTSNCDNEISASPDTPFMGKEWCSGYMDGDNNPQCSDIFNPTHSEPFDASSQDGVWAVGLFHGGQGGDAITSFKISTKVSIPEFPTVALPIAAVIGLVFFFQHKKRKEE